MKKSLLLLGAALVASVAVRAQEATPNKVYQDMRIQGVSPDGTFGVSNIDARFDVINFKTGQVATFFADSETPMLGFGNAVANNGLFTCTLNDMGSDASYWFDGEFHTLLAGEDGFCGANGVTPDASRICGCYGEVMYSDTEVMMQPVVWDRNAEGEYVMTRLPFPEKDIFNSVPQYVTAIAISADGKTVVGQVVSNDGSLVYPIVYTEGEEGWSYAIPNEELWHPEGVTVPVYPGSDADCPDATDYMDEDKRAEYNKAWEDYDWEGPAPDPMDYMTDEQKAAYGKAMEAYEAWYAKYEEFEGALGEYLAAVPTFDYNNIFLSTNGRFMTSSCGGFNFFTGEGSFEPAVFDLQDKTYKVYPLEGKMLESSYVSNNGQIMAYSPVMDYATRCTYVIPAPGADWMTLEAYVQTRNEDAATWMKENMCHTWDELAYEENPETEDWEEVVINHENEYLTGTCTADADFETIYSWALATTWDETIDYYYESYAINLGPDTGIKGVAADTKAVSATMDKNGVVTINGDATEIVICDMAGRVVFSQKAPASTVNTGLRGGAYIIKVKSATSSAVAKAIN